MKITLVFLAAAAPLLALLAPDIHAQNSIGWNYQGVGGIGLAPTDTAGAPGFEQDNWNNHAGAGQGPGTVPLNDLFDSSGNITTADVTAWTLSTNNSWQHNQTGSPDEILLNDFNDQRPSLTFSEIPFTANGYTVVVYYGNNEGPSVSTLNVGSQSRTITTGNTALSSFGSAGYLEGTDVNGDTPTNYAVFPGVSGPSLTVSLSGTNNNGISAIQIIEQLDTDPPGPPSGPSPANSAVNIAIDTILDWADAVRANQYDVFLWPSADPEPAVPTATVAASAYDPPVDLLESTGYSWKVVARNSAGGASTTGPVWTFTTGANIPPDPPANPVPVSGATGIDPAVVLDWADSALAASYNVYIWIPPASPPALPTAVTTSSQYDPPGDLAIGVEYRWTAEAANGSGTTPATDPFWSFTTLAPPSGPPANPVPANTATGVSPLTGLDWDEVANATGYNVRLWLTGDLRPVDPTATVATSAYQSPEVLEFSTGYTWEVEAVNSLGTTTGGPWSFTTSGTIADTRKIGWNMQGVGGVGLAPVAVAGAPGFTQSQWNNHPSMDQTPGETPLFDLVDNTGAATTADVVSWTQSTPNGWEHDQTDNPDEILMNDFANREPAIVFAEIPFPRYDVLVYYGNNEGPSTSTLTVGAESRTITTGNTAQSSFQSVGYIEGTPENTDLPTNYAIFAGLFGPDLTVSLAGANNNGISAIQIVQETGGPPFIITGFAFTGDGPVITFNSNPGVLYAIDRSTDFKEWNELTDSYPTGGATGDSTSFTDTGFATDFPGVPPLEVFYRVRVPD